MVEERFLIDANSFIASYKNFYPFDIAPGFWEQLRNAIMTESVTVLDIVRAEILKGDDELNIWISEMSELEVMDRREQGIMKKYREVINYLQSSSLYNEKALRAWSDESVADPWLIAVAAANECTIITFEQSAGKISENAPSGRPKIPDVAKAFNVKCENLYYFMRKMNICWE